MKYRQLGFFRLFCDDSLFSDYPIRESSDSTSDLFDIYFYDNDCNLMEKIIFEEEQGKINDFTASYDLVNKYCEIRGYNDELLFKLLVKAHEAQIIQINKTLKNSVIEEIIYSICIPVISFLNDNFIPFHGTTLVKGKNMIVILADSNVGKSTLSAYLMKKHDFQLITDDISILKLNESNPVISSLGHNVRLREDSFMYLSDYFQYDSKHLKNNKYHIMLKDNVGLIENRKISFFFLEESEIYKKIKGMETLKSYIKLCKSLYAPSLAIPKLISDKNNLIFNKMKEFNISFYELPYVKKFEMIEIIASGLENVLNLM